jgi:hypothetical protein
MQRTATLLEPVAKGKCLLHAALLIVIPQVRIVYVYYSTRVPVAVPVAVPLTGTTAAGSRCMLAPIGEGVEEEETAMVRLGLLLSGGIVAMVAFGVSLCRAVKCGDAAMEATFRAWASTQVVPSARWPGQN